MRRREGERDNYIARDGGRERERERESKPEEVNERELSERGREGARE